MPAPLSVVIPTLNAAADLGPTAEALLSGATDGLIRELVISDGGSSDDTRRVARELGALWVEGPAGRAGQIARGVTAASGDWLLILHADTWLSDGWTDAARRHMNGHRGAAGYFRLRFRAEGVAPRLAAGGANLRARMFGLPSGDQALLIPRVLLAEVGGVPDVAQMEHIDLARSLRGRLRPLDADALAPVDRHLVDSRFRNPGI